MDKQTKAEIEKVAAKILRDAGLTQPPITPGDLIEHLKLNLDFYSLEDPSFVQKLTHKFKIKVQHVKKALKKTNLVAAWMPDCSKILIDNTLPEKKKVWPQFHEITHSILPWHKDFFIGDTAQTLDPHYQEALEVEANYGASELMFCGKVFRNEVQETSLNIKNVKALSKSYGTTLTTTMRKMVISQEEVSCFAAISIPKWDLDEKAGTLKHLDASPEMQDQFSEQIKSSIEKQINKGIFYRSGGPVGNFTIEIKDRNGELYAFECESFYNSFEILTIGIQLPDPIKTDTNMLVLDFDE